MKSYFTRNKFSFLALIVAIIFFIIPFFWLKPGFVDLGGDAGRLYFLDPLAVARNLYSYSNLAWATSHAIIPYELFLAFLHRFITSPTNMIVLEHGVQLSLAFLFMFLVIRDILSLSSRRSDVRVGWVSIAGGLVYVGFVTSMGWATSLPSLNQVFLNPLLFYLLLRYCLNRSFWYMPTILLLTLLYSINFGFSSMPQIMSFYPLVIGFLLIVLSRLFGRSIPWRGLLTLGLLFVGLHSFHIIPTIASIVDTSTTTHSYVLSDQSIQYSGVHYFAVNHEALGKISTELFAPSKGSQNLLILLIPIIILLGFMGRPSKLLAVVGIFFAVTFFLVSANITKLGVELYQKLFYIPGFMMFRSFNEKWYPVFAFFYVLLFAFSFYSLVKNKKPWIVVALSLILIGSTIYRIIPFLQGKAIDVPHYQSKNVSTVFSMDPDLMDTVSFVRILPEGKVLTLPLTFPYYQIAYGKEGGAYVGVSMIINLAGREDFTGFWRFGEYAQGMFDAIHDEDVNRILQILSSLKVRYVFYNSDSRIMDNFPDYPYIYPGLMYSSKDQLPAIRDQAAYKSFLAKLPLKKIYEKGFYSLYEIGYAHPPVYTSNFETPARENQYFFIGRLLSVATLVIFGLLIFRELVRRRNEKN